MATKKINREDECGRALVTGASSGIGLAIADELAKHGHDLVLVARRKDRLKTIARNLAGKYRCDVRTIECDFSSPGAAEKLYAEMVNSGLSVSILVNNAGRGNVGAFAEQNASDMRGTLELNMVSLTMLTRLAAEDMIKQGHGRILNIASVAAFMPGPGFAAYHATKSYVLSLSEALNEEFKGTGVSVTVSCPGPTESEFHRYAATDELKNFNLMKLMSAERVAEEAYKGMQDGKALVVHGLINNVLTLTPKALPRSWVPTMVRKLMR